MMSLLKSCGVVITSVNKRFYRFLRRSPFKRFVKSWREESVSLTLTMAVFVAFLSIGIWHNTMDESDHHTIVDIIYFWVVSFTTVGFGDIGHSIEFEIRHAYELTAYRVFGLSLVAAIIDSVIECIESRQKSIAREMELYQRKILEKIQLAVRNSIPKEARCSVANGVKYIGFSVTPVTTDVDLL